MDVVFFDLGETLGTARFAAGSTRVRAFDPYPDVPILLEQLCRDRVRLGVISNTPSSESQESMRAVLDTARIYRYFAPELLIYSSVVGHEKDSSEIFKLAVVRAGLSASPENCVFVGERKDERDFAVEAGLRAFDPESFWQTRSG